VVQIFLIATLFSQQAFFLALELTSAMTLIPYLLVAAYGLKLAFTGETYEQASSRRTKELIIAAIATSYAVLMLWAGGVEKLLLSALILVPGTVLFFMARNEQRLKVFKFWEMVLFAITAIAAVSALVGLATNRIIL
jgi:arginine:ornithine antiporter/lysine permease